MPQTAQAVNEQAHQAGIQRFPRNKDDIVPVEQVDVETRIAQLDAQVFRSAARRREANLEIGRACIELKKILGHGKWQTHFADILAPSGITLRTVERYMRRAKEAAAQAKNDSGTIFKPAADEYAASVRSATKHSQAKLSAASAVSGARKRPARLYRLTLRGLADHEHDAVDALRKLTEWPSVEKKLVSFLRKQFVKYGVLTGSVRRPA
jgi:hypothetical protein